MPGDNLTQYAIDKAEGDAAFFVGYTASAGGEAYKSAKRLLAFVDKVRAYHKHVTAERKEYGYRTEDIDVLVRELDVIWNGEDGAAPQAMLCDVVGQIARWKRNGGTRSE